MSNTQYPISSLKPPATSLWIILVLILVAFAIRTHDLDARSLWIDEGTTFYRANQDVSFILTNHIIIDGVVTTDTQPPLYFILLHWALQGAGATPFVARLFSALVSLPSIALLYLIGRRLGGQAAGLCAALTAALAPVYLWYGQEARPYTLLISLSLLSVYALLRLVAIADSRWQMADSSYQPSAISHRPIAISHQPPATSHQLSAISYLPLAIVYVLATGATVYTHYSGLFLLGFQGLFLLALAVRRRRRWLIVLLAGATALVSPIIPFVVHRMGLGAEQHYFFVPLRTILWDLANGLSLGLSVRAEQVWWLDVLFLLIALLGLVALTRAGRRGWAVWLVGYLAVPILTLYAASYVKPMYMGVRHLLIISPAYYLALGLGLAALASQGEASRAVAHWRRLALVAGIAVIVVGTGYSTRNYFTDPAYLKDDHRGLAAYLEEHVRPGDVIVADGSIRGYVLDFYYDGLAPLMALPPYGTEPGPQTLASLQALARRYQRIWFAYGIPGDDWVDSAGEMPIRAWRQESLFQFAEKYFHGLDDVISLRGYLTRSPVLTRLPAQVVPVGAHLGSRLELVGAEVPGQAQTRVSEVLTTVVAGDPLDVKLYWRARQPLEDYRVVLSLVDEEGRRWGLCDKMPYESFFPPSEWPIGQIVAWVQTLRTDPTTPPGHYTVNLRVYEPASDRALDFIGPDGNPVGQQFDLGQVDIVRPAGPTRLPPGLPASQLRARWATAPGVTDIELMGYDQPVKRVGVGHPALLNLYFLARGKASADLSLRLRLVDRAGREVAASVAPPVARAYPTSQWQPGDVLKGQHRLVVPASATPGQYTWCLRLEDEAGDVVPVHRGWWPVAVKEICLGAVTVEAPPLAPTPALIPRPLAATFEEPSAPGASSGKGIRLLGYDLAEMALHPGQDFLVTLFWRAEAPVAVSYKVTVQLLSAEGKIVAQDDSVPVHWTRPTTGWRPGEVILDGHTLTVDPQAPSGRYALIVALYHEGTGQRLLVSSGDQPADHVRLAELVIEGQ